MKELSGIIFLLLIFHTGCFMDVKYTPDHPPIDDPSKLTLDELLFYAGLEGQTTDQAINELIRRGSDPSIVEIIKIAPSQGRSYDMNINGILFLLNDDKPRRFEELYKGFASYPDGYIDVALEFFTRMNPETDKQYILRLIDLIDVDLENLIIGKNSVISHKCTWLMGEFPSIEEAREIIYQIIQKNDIRKLGFEQMHTYSQAIVALGRMAESDNNFSCSPEIVSILEGYLSKECSELYPRVYSASYYTLESLFNEPPKLELGLKVPEKL